MTGDVELLPVQHLSRSAPEWRSIVGRHAAAFDRAQRMPWSPGRVRSLAALQRWLLNNEVDLWRVTMTDRDYFYFEVTDAGTSNGPCPAAQAFEGRIEVARQKRSRVLHVQPVMTKCGDLTEIIELVGAVSYRGTIRFVIKSSGDDWQDYKVVDPHVSLTWRQF